MPQINNSTYNQIYTLRVADRERLQW